jgi:hypothetical protein
MYLVIVSVLFNLFVINSASLTDRGVFDWKKMGSTTAGHIAGANGGVTVSSSGSCTLLQQYEPRVYLMDPTTTTNYYRFNMDLTGNTIQFNVDVSKTNYGCNSAVYLVQMPSSYTAGSYCDAQCNPNGCVEIDLMEANLYGFQSTLHAGDCSTNGKNGCAFNVHGSSTYGPGGSNIDTNKVFTVTYSFTKSSSGTFNGVTIKLSQSGKSGITASITDSTCSYMSSNYVSSLASSIKSGQMVMVNSFWSSNMAWLDGNGANDCSSSATTTMSSFQLISGVTAVTSDEVSDNNNGLPFVQSPVFIGIMCAIGTLLLVGIIAVILIKRKNALNQEIV